MGAVLTHPEIGRAAAKLYRDRISYRGIRVSTDDACIRPEEKAALFWRLYERREAIFVENHLRRDVHVLELGAGLGAISCLIRRRLEPERSLVAVEADPRLVRLAERNLQLNFGRIRPFVVVHGAVDYRTSRIGRSVSFVRSASHLGGHVGDPSTPEREALLVPRVTVQELVEQYRLEPYALVSDIEGGEAGLVLAGADALAGCVQIIVELHETTWNGRTISIGIMLERLQQYGFSLVDRHGPICVLSKASSN